MLVLSLMRDIAAVSQTLTPYLIMDSNSVLYILIFKIVSILFLNLYIDAKQGVVFSVIHLCGLWKLFIVPYYAKLTLHW